MSKGMSLQQFKKALESDATIQVETQKKIINGLNKQIKEKEEKIKELENRFQIMCNRCMAHTQGLICLYCGYKEDCNMYKGVDKK